MPLFLTRNFQINVFESVQRREYSVALSVNCRCSLRKLIVCFCFVFQNLIACRQTDDLLHTSKPTHIHTYTHIHQFRVHYFVSFRMSEQFYPFQQYSNSFRWMNIFGNVIIQLLWELQTPIPVCLCTICILITFIGNNEMKMSLQWQSGWEMKNKKWKDLYERRKR